MEEKVVNFLKQRIGSDRVLKREDNFFQLGLVNSIFSLRLITFLENEFSIKIENEDLRLDNFNSVSNIVAFLERKESK